MTNLIRFEVVGEPRFGNFDSGWIVVQDDDFVSSEMVAVDGAKVLTPPTTKMIMLCNNFYALKLKLSLPASENPMFFLKATNYFLATGENIRRSATGNDKLVYEGEFGIVIGKTYANVSEEDEAAQIFAMLLLPPSSCRRWMPPSTSGRENRASSR